jgi:ABC-type nitrate/sulfonate/bicarbonate transport system permease component
MSRVAWVRLSGIAVVLLTWEAVGRSGLILHEVFPPLSEVLRGLASVLADATTRGNALVTAVEIAAGFAIGSGAGLVLGLLLGVVPYADRVLQPILYYLGAIPKIIVYPILILLLGAAEGSKIGIASLSAVFPVAINTAVAARQVRPALIRAAQTLGAQRSQMLLKVYLPAMAGDVLSGLRIGLAVATIGALLAETSVAQAGLGLQAIRYYSQLQIPEMYALLLLVFTVATLINAAFTWLIARWTRHQHGGQGITIP